MAFAETATPKPTGLKQKIEVFISKTSRQLDIIWDKINVVGKFEAQGKKMKKQNDTVVENAANGVHTPVAKRTVSSSEKVRAIQENLDKANAEKIKKYDTVE